MEQKIKDAAKVRNDQRVLLDIEGKDLKAIEYSYHRTCYSANTIKSQSGLSIKAALGQNHILL